MESFEAKFSYLPERISRLGELACNLWWSWHPEAKVLFHMLGGNGAEFKALNPVKLLCELEGSVLDLASKDTRFLRRYDAVMLRFDTEMRSRGTWFNSEIDSSMRPIAYFSAEYGIHHSLPFYAGGLGFLAGDYLKECSDLGVPLLGMGFMYPEGYLHQKISSDGWQIDESETLDRDKAPICRVLDASNTPMIIKMPIMELPVYFEVWKAQIGRIPLYLIDTDISSNDPWNRGTSARLYVGDLEQRLMNEIILGIGGVQVLHTLDLEPSILHLNEGHSAFAILEMIRIRMGQGLSFREASEEIRAMTVFTTHTPISTGHDVFPFSLMEKYFNSYIPLLELDSKSFLELGADPRNPNMGFNLTAFALRMSAYHNAVSKRHSNVSMEMWQNLWEGRPNGIDYITNGIHIPTWIDARIMSLFNRYLGPNWLEDHDKSCIWQLVDDIPEAEIWMTHRLLKMGLIAAMQERSRRRWKEDNANPNIILASGIMFDPNALTIGFARRFAAYKRADLLLDDLDRLRSILNHPKRPVQIVFAGKAHPADDLGKQLIKKIFCAAQDPSFGGRLAFVEDYDEELAQYLVHGVDLWLNNPLPPLEASGTSGMKASINGVPNLSILDGWWIEGYNGRNGWAFNGVQPSDLNVSDSQELYSIIEKEIVPLYYERDLAGIPCDWVMMMKESIKSIGPRFNSRRMVKEYILSFYQEIMRNSHAEDSIEGQIDRVRSFESCS